MAETDWVSFSNEASSAEVLALPTMAPSLVPPDGGLFTFGARSLVADAKFRGKVSTRAGLHPVPANKGGSISAYLRKHSPSSGNCLYSPLLFLLDGHDLASDPEGYLLGLSEGAPYYIQLRKGRLLDGLPQTSYLARSSASFTGAQWIGLKLDLVHNPQGDLVLNVYRDLSAPLSPAAPDWQRIAGFSSSYVDDNLGVLSGSVPITAQKYLGFGFFFRETSAVASIDYVKHAAQLTP